MDFEPVIDNYKNRTESMSLERLNLWIKTSNIDIAYQPSYKAKIVELYDDNVALVYEPSKRVYTGRSETLIKDTVRDLTDVDEVDDYILCSLDFVDEDKLNN